MRRISARSVACAALALCAACGDELGGVPLLDVPGPGWAVDTDTADEMVARGGRLAACVPATEDAPEPDPGGLGVGDIRVGGVRGAPHLRVEQFNLRPHRFDGRPRLVIDVRAGDLPLPGPDPTRYIHIFDGIDGCGRNVARMPLPPAAEVDGPITLRASSTGWLPQREWVFVLDPR